MSLQVRLQALITAIGADVKALQNGRGKLLGVATATADSTATSTDILDTGTATIAFTAVSGHSYTVKAVGQAVMSTVSGDLVRVLIRDSGSASVPTNTSATLVAQPVSVPAAGTGGKTGVGGLERIVQCPADIAVGVHTIGLFRNRAGGTGNVSLSASLGSRQLVVMDNGLD